jgi:cytochrome c553
MALRWRCAAAPLLLLALEALAQQPAPAFAPANLSPEGVRQMASTCAPCHGTGGRPAPGSIGAALAGRSSGDIVNAMRQFRDGTRPATVMHQIAKGFSDAEIGALADYFSRVAR